MATSGSFTTNAYGGVRSLTFNWSLESQSISGNYSVINWNFVGSGSSASTWYYTKNGYLNINGSRVFTQGDNKVQLAVGTVLASGKTTIYHNNDGTKHFGADGGATIYSYGTYETGSGGWDLPTIARASEPSCITYPNTTQNVGNLGDTFTIHMNRKSSSFTHTVKYAWGNKSGTIATGVTDNCNWTLPKNFAENVPNGTSGTGTITVETYNGSTHIGTKSVSFTATIPNTAEFKPSISSVSLSEAGGVPSSVGNFIQNRSKIKGVVSASGAYGSTISSYSVSINNEAFTTSTFTTSLISLVNPTLKVEVKDSRGRTASYSTTVTVLKYEVPTINSFVSYRNSSNTSKIDLVFNCDIYSLGGKNTKSFIFYYRKSGDSNFTAITVDSSKIKETHSGDKYTYSANYSIFTSDPNQSYDTKLVVDDLFNSIESIGSFVNTIFKFINISADKKNYAVGKLHEKPGFNEKAVPEIHYENIHRVNGEYDGMVLSCPSIQDGEIRFNSSNNSLELVINNVTYAITLTRK